MKKYTYLLLSFLIIFGLVACNNGEKEEERIDAEVDPSAKMLYKNAMTELFFNDNVAPLENSIVKINGTDVTAAEALKLQQEELKKHKYVQEYFNLAYYYNAFEKQTDGSYLLDVTVELSDGDNIHTQEHQITFTGEPDKFQIAIIDIKTVE
jgi:hypothetical protein